MSPVEFTEAENIRIIPEQYLPTADHSDAAMRRLLTPFEPDPA